MKAHAIRPGPRYFFPPKTRHAATPTVNLIRSTLVSAPSGARAARPIKSATAARAAGAAVCSHDAPHMRLTLLLAASALITLTSSARGLMRVSSGSRRWRGSLSRYSSRNLGWRLVIATCCPLHAQPDCGPQPAVLGTCWGCPPSPLRRRRCMYAR